MAAQEKQILPPESYFLRLLKELLRQVDIRCNGKCCDGNSPLVFACRRATVAIEEWEKE